MAFEGYSLYPPLTVRENIAFALKSARVSREETDRRVAEIAALVEIESILDRYPSSISGGQQQRASLARALVRRADLYLLDEPMGQLEPQLRSVLRGRIKNLLNQHKMTAIFVTHDQTEANALADRIAVMEGGVLQQFASEKDLKAEPANLYVATFIGEPPMNVFEARVRQSGSATVLDIDGGPTLDFGGAGLGPAPERLWARAARPWSAFDPTRSGSGRAVLGQAGLEPVARRPGPCGDGGRGQADGRRVLEPRADRDGRRLGL